MNHEQTKRETWQEVLMRVLDTHISRRNALNVPLELTLPYDAVVALKGLIEREYGGTEAQAEFGKGSETAFDGDRRLFEVKMTHNGRTVTISYDPSDMEAVQTAETWRKFLFAPKPTNAEKRAYGGYSIKVSNEPCYHLSGVVMSDNPDSVSFYDRDGDEILRVNSNFLVSILRVDKGKALMEFMPHEAAVNAGGDNEQWEGE